METPMRFFAKVRAADLECPNCGTLIRFGQGRYQTRHWKPHLSRLTCSSCRRVYIIGLLAWPVQLGGKTKPTVPADHLPGARVRAQMRAELQMRAEGGGFWATTPKGWRAEQTNLTCRCATVPDQPVTHDESCPFFAEQELASLLPQPSA